MRKRFLQYGVLLLAACAPAARPQSTPVVYQTLFTARQTTGTFTVRNIGQVSHHLSLTVDGAGCTYVAGSFNAGFEASFDGTNFFRIGAIIDATQFEGSVQTAVTDALGSYPTVRVNLRTFADGGATCTATGFYSGSMAVYEQRQVQLGEAVWGNLTISAAGNTTFTPALASARAVLYGISLWNTGAQTITISCSGGAITLTTFTANTSYVLESDHPLFKCSDNVDLVVNLSVGTTVNVRARVRYE